LTFTFESEAALCRTAAEIARRWIDAGRWPLLIGLSGELGSGKTTWVRAMLRGLGYEGRVPSPTYTLLETYPLESLTLVHMDLYRLGGADELEHLGIRDWLARDDVWVLVEWPERVPLLHGRCDVGCEFRLTGPQARCVDMAVRTPAGRAALGAINDIDSNFTS
jgi:tRNA threonylcarbamoyladenosine biosynthesis protein TsaE